jgi:ribose 5-phosphate isomerase B
MKIFIASDHAGVDLKKNIIEHVKDKFEVLDLGPNSCDSVDYPDFAKKVCTSVLKEKAYGILICGTGIGMSMSANKFKGIRASLCSDTFSARMTRMHNDANVLCLGARVLGIGLALDIVSVWLENTFQEGRHKKRVDKIEA